MANPHTSDSNPVVTNPNSKYSYAKRRPCHSTTFSIRIAATQPLTPVAIGLILGLILGSQPALDFRYGYWFAALAAITIVYFFMMVGRHDSRLRGHVIGWHCPAKQGSDAGRAQPAALSDRNPPNVNSRAGLAAVFLASLCVGGALAQCRLNQSAYKDPNSIEHYATESGAIVRLRGVVVSEPRQLSKEDNPFAWWTYGGDRTAFLLEVHSIECEGDEGFVDADGTISVVAGEQVLDLEIFQEVELFGRLRTLMPPCNPGAFDWAQFNRERGVVARISIAHRESVRRIAPAIYGSSGVDIREAKTREIDTRKVDTRESAVQWMSSWFRRTVRQLLVDDLLITTDSAEPVTLLETMVLGQRQRIHRRVNDLFVRAGCAHFLAVSGAHLGMLMSFGWLIGRTVGWPRRRTAWLMLLIIAIYLLLAEPRPPILRAGVMAGLFCVALLLHRPIMSLNWLAAAAIILLFFDPSLVFDIGFQLSFVAVWSVLRLAPALWGLGRQLRAWFEYFVLRNPFTEEDRKLRAHPQGLDGLPQSRAVRWAMYVRKAIFGAVTISLAAWLATLPIITLHFHRVQTWGVITSIAVMPLVWLTVVLAFVKLIVGMLFPTLAAGLGLLLVRVEGILIEVVELFSDLPWSTLSSAAPPAWLIALYYVFLFLFSRYFRPRREFTKTETKERPWKKSDVPRHRGLGTAVFSAFVSLIMGAAYWHYKPIPPRMTLTVLSVGPGSAMLLELPDGQTLVCDAGSSFPFDTARSAVLPYLRKRGIQRLDRVYISHANLDHYSAMLTLIDEMPVGPVVLSEYFEIKAGERSPSRYFLEQLSQRRHPVHVLSPSQSNWAVGEVSFEVLWPRDPIDPALETNETSLVMRITYTGHSILLTGDIEEHAQRALLAANLDLKADVLVLPHHGGVVSSTKDFIEAVDADILIRSSHQKMTETTNGLREIIGSAPVYNTTDVGSVQVMIDERGIHVEPFWQGNKEE